MADENPKQNEKPGEASASSRELGSHLERLARHAKISVPSSSLGTYDFANPSPTPNTAETGVSIADLQYVFATIGIVSKGVIWRANRVVGEGFELTPSDRSGADPATAKQARDECQKFFDEIGGLGFTRQSCINAYVSGNEWSELVYNKLGSMINVVHGDFETIDFRRNFINNKILLDGRGEPVGYWQYIRDLSELYFSLSTYYGDVPAYENLQAARARLRESQSLTIHATDPETGQTLEVGIMFATTKPNYQFLKKKEIAHLSFLTVNDNWYGVSLIIPAYNAINHLEQVMYATAEAINSMGYPKPVVTVGDPTHSPNETEMNKADELVKNPARKESFSIPYWWKLAYLEPGSTGTSNISQYPEWFVTEVAMGLRVPVDVLKGTAEGRAGQEVNASDFDKDAAADRWQLDRYLYTIFNYFLDSRGYKESSRGENLYLPRIRWRSLITADEALREKMALERWNAGAIKFNELRRALKMDEEQDARGNQYKFEVERVQGSAGGGLEYGGELGVQDGMPVSVNPLESGSEITGKKSKSFNSRKNDALNEMRRFAKELSDEQGRKCPSDSEWSAIKTEAWDMAVDLSHEIESRTTGERGESFHEDRQAIRRELNNAFHSEWKKLRVQIEEKSEILARHALDPKKKLNPELNKRFGTSGVDFKRVAQERVGKKIRVVGEKRAKKIRDALVNSEAKRKGASAIRKKVARLAGVSDEHARMIVRTEHHNLAEGGYLTEAKSKGMKFKKWVSVMDADTSPVCKALNGQIAGVDEDFAVMFLDEQGKQKTWKGSAPSAHPNCRSTLAFALTKAELR
ncbi:MAG: phage head morphogenesis protein [Candidatus Omnitrophica bacterium]|nr:phage head morphogenesis protein [Candidatus Omnitrophota bacterium]